jgi:dethiobiotin synthetase/adenosylmethionine--8-amino-7-oxononanoate aminotransferase
MKSPLASLLWRSLRVHQVFGANTDVGKTIFTTLLARTAKKLWKNEHVAFLKPVSTGAADEADDRCKATTLLPTFRAACG